jgi:hypothetical protein
MNLLIELLGAATIAQQVPSTERQPCPSFTPGKPYPWESREILPGDQWVWVYLLIDKRGRATDCRIGEGNIRDKDRRGIICMSFQKNWYTKPILKDGQPIEGWFKRYFIITGTKHQMRDLEARRLYLQQHPNERPECYPEYGR